MTTSKREYEKPSMQVFEELEQQLQLLADSGGTEPYTPDNNDYNW